MHHFLLFTTKEKKSPFLIYANDRLLSFGNFSQTLPEMLKAHRQRKQKNYGP